MASDGAADLIRMSVDIAAAGVRVQTRAGLVMGKTLRDIEAGAKNRAPVDTGNLRSSISSRVSGSGGSVRGEVGPTANYGGYVENGTRRMAGQPYLRPATDAALPGYEAAIAQLMTEGL